MYCSGCDRVSDRQTVYCSGCDRVSDRLCTAVAVIGSVPGLAGPVSVYRSVPEVHTDLSLRYMQICR